MKRSIERVCGAALALAAWASGQTPGTAVPEPEASRRPALDVLPDVEQFLRQSVEQVRWDDVTLESVCDWLAERSAVNVLVDWKALAAQGVAADTLVSVHLRHVRVMDVLDAALNDAAQDGSLTYQGRGNVLRISTSAHFEREMIVRVYDVEDVVARVPDFRGAPQIQIAAQGASGPGASEPLISGTSTDPGEAPQTGRPAAAEEDPPLAELRGIIEAVIKPRSWAVNGGEGIIRVFDGRLVIRNTIEVHEMIAGRVSVE